LVEHGGDAVTRVNRLTRTCRTEALKAVGASIAALLRRRDAAALRSVAYLP
jgi:hypothetical protein